MTLVDELQRLARLRDTLSAGSADLQELRAHAESHGQPGAGLDGIHVLIADATATLNVAERDAAILLFGKSENRFDDNLKTRRTAAGKLLGLTESTFRKKRDGTSPYDNLTFTVAEAIRSTAPHVDIVPPSPTDPSPKESGTRRRPPVLAFVAALATTVAIGAVFWSPSDGPELATQDAEIGGTDPVTEESVDRDNEAETPPEVDDVTDPDGEDGPAYQPGLPIEGCDIPVGGGFGPGGPSAAVSVAAVDAYKAATDEAALTCPLAVIERWDALWVQPITTSSGQIWRITVEEQAPEFAFVLSQQLYLGYRRILDGPGVGGTMAQGIAGFPRVVDNSGNHPSIRFSNGSVLIGESDQTPARWISAEGAAVWDDLGGVDGSLGLPITDVNYIDGLPRQDFQRGFGTADLDLEIMTMALSAEEIEADIAQLERRTSMILETFDGTSWWIDADGVRHWIPDAATWVCLGGEDVKVGEITDGWVLGSFLLGDEAICE